MTMTTIYEVFLRYLPAYLKASKQNKQAILDKVCDITNVHRESAIRKFRKLQFRRGSSRDYRGRPIIYGPDVIAAFKNPSVFRQKKKTDLNPSFKFSLIGTIFLTFSSPC